MKGERGKRFRRALRGLLLPAVILAVLLCFFTGLSNLQDGSGEAGRQQLEASIRRTAAACYAAEGIYPPDISYMEQKYGLQVDESRYFVDYQIFASNLMPTITVLEQTERR